MAQFSWNTYIWASVWAISGVLMTIQSTPKAVLFKIDVHGHVRQPSVSGGGEGASPARAADIPASCGAFSGETLALPKVLPLLWRTWMSDSTLTVLFLLSLHSGISGCWTAGCALRLSFLKHFCIYQCTSGAVGNRHTPSSPSFHQPPHHILQALHKQEPELKQLGAAPSSRSIPSLSIPSCCLSSVFSHFWCQQLSLSAEVSWVLRGLVHSLYIHTPGSFGEVFLIPFPWWCVCPPDACCAPQHLNASGVFYCVS